MIAFISPGWQFTGAHYPLELGDGVKLAPHAHVVQPEFSKWIDYAFLPGASHAPFVLYLDHGDDLPPLPGEVRDGTQAARVRWELSRLQRLTLANWLSAASSFVFSRVAHLEFSGNTVTGSFCETVAGAFPTSEERRRMNSADELLAAGRLSAVIARLQASGTLRTAIAAGWHALIQQDWSLRYLLSWIALEGLFGASDPQELSYRLCERIALFLADGEHARSEFRALRAAYAERSRIVHGRRTTSTPSSELDLRMQQVEGWVRRSLVKILESPAHIEVFDGNDRDRFLASLPFLGPRIDAPG